MSANMNLKLILCLILLVTNFIASAVESGVEQYRLGSGDIVKISVFGEEDLSLETRLPQTGVISYPFLGDIKAVELTVSELERFIFAGLEGDYLISPSVSVTVIEYRPFFIDGEVKESGGYPYQPGLSVDKAAALAGGYTERASKTKIVIVRDISGVQTTLSAQSSDIVLPGDIITIQQTFF
jgi:protein involved in polysaccharide export with SLBB domain